MKKSNLLNINWKDALKGFIVAVITAILAAVYTGIQNNTFPVTWADWRTILIAGCGAGISYVIKNVFTNSDDKFLKPEKKKS